MAASRSPTSPSACDLPPSTAHRLLSTLEKMGYVYQAGDLGLWYVGLQAFTVGAGFLANRDFVAQSHAVHAPPDGAVRRDRESRDPRRHRGRVHRPGPVPRDDAHPREARQPRAAARVGRRQGDLRLAARRADRRDPQGEGPAAHHAAHDRRAGDDVGGAQGDPPARLFVRRRGARARHALRRRDDLRRARRAAGRDLAGRTVVAAARRADTAAGPASSRTPPRSSRARLGGRWPHPY